MMDKFENDEYNNSYKIEFEHAADEHPDHSAGHVIFSVQTLLHERFIRKGHDLHYIQKISLLESLVGFKTTVKHLDGHLVNLQSGGVTQHGDIQRIAKEGMPHHNVPSQRGDLFVKYEVVFPTQLTQHQKDAFDKILPK